jgi:hypothetical protein
LGRGVEDSRKGVAGYRPEIRTLRLSTISGTPYSGMTHTSNALSSSSIVNSRSSTGSGKDVAEDIENSPSDT